MNLDWNINLIYTFFYHFLFKGIQHRDYFNLLKVIYRSNQSLTTYKLSIHWFNEIYIFLLKELLLLHGSSLTMKILPYSYQDTQFNFLHMWVACDNCDFYFFSFLSASTYISRYSTAIISSYRATSKLHTIEPVSIVTIST